MLHKMCFAMSYVITYTDILMLLIAPDKSLAAETDIEKYARHVCLQYEMEHHPPSFSLFCWPLWFDF